MLDIGNPGAPDWMWETLSEPPAQAGASPLPGVAGWRLGVRPCPQGSGGGVGGFRKGSCGQPSWLILPGRGQGWRPLSRSAQRGARTDRAGWEQHRRFLTGRNQRSEMNPPSFPVLGLLLQLCGVSSCLERGRFQDRAPGKEAPAKSLQIRIERKLSAPPSARPAPGYLALWGAMPASPTEERRPFGVR